MDQISSNKMGSKILCGFYLLVLGYLQIVKAFPLDTKFPVPCGRVFRRESRIINGSYADTLNFPSIVSIKQDGRHMCGGSIISERFILSAAHCDIKPNENWSVTLGEYNLGENETFSATYGIQDVILHDDYDRFTSLLNNDIVLLKLDEDIQWTNHIQPICLPTENVEKKQDALVAGWGGDWRSTAEVENEKLRFVKLDILENEECNDIYAEKNLHLRLSKTQMCAGTVDGEIRDTTSGDSGGPLLLEMDGRQVLVGITSGATPESIYPKSPGIYTRVFEYMDWITKEISEERTQAQKKRQKQKQASP